MASSQVGSSANNSQAGPSPIGRKSSKSSLGSNLSQKRPFTPLDRNDSQSSQANTTSGRTATESKNLYAHYDVQNFTFGSSSAKSEPPPSPFHSPTIPPSDSPLRSTGPNASQRRRGPGQHARSNDSNPNSASGTEASSSASASVTSFFASEQLSATPMTSAPTTEDDTDAIEFSEDDSDELDFGDEYEYENDSDDIEISSTIHEGSVFDGSVFNPSYGSPSYITDSRRPSECTILRTDGTILTDRRGSASTVTRLANMSGSSQAVGSSTVGGSGSGSGSGSQTLQGTMRFSTRSSVPNFHLPTRSVAGEPLSSIGTSSPTSPTSMAHDTSYAPGSFTGQTQSVMDGFNRNDWDMIQGGQIVLDPSEFLSPTSSIGKSDSERRGSVSRRTGFPWNRKKKKEINETDTFERAAKNWTSDQTYYSQWTWRQVTDDAAMVDGSNNQGRRSERKSSLTAINSFSLAAASTALSGSVVRSASDPASIWSIDVIGQFEVTIKWSSPAPGKRSQHLLKAFSLRDPTITNKPRSPPIVVHRHSKATAFSITRTHKTTSSINSTSLTTTKGANMVLLASRKVQLRYTHTTTTKMLPDWQETALDDLLSSGAMGSKDMMIASSTTATLTDSPSGEGHSLDSRPRQRRRRKDDPAATLVESSDDMPSIPSSSAASPNQQASESFYSHSIVLESPSSTSQSQSSHDDGYQSGPSEDVSGENDDDLDELPGRRRRRTPHPEAFGAVDASVLEQLRASDHRQSISYQRPNLKSEVNIKMRRLWKSDPTSATSNGLSTIAMVMGKYTPPWVITLPREQQEAQKQMVDNLNTSFEGVGLLPAARDKTRDHRERDHYKKASGLQHKTLFDKKGLSGSLPVSLFDQVPDEVLFMLLPLWVGDTDSRSKQKFPYTVESTPLDKRQFLMVYYKHQSLNSERKSHDHKGKQKQSKGETSSSSFEKTSRRSSRHHSQLAFHIIARLVSYSDLKGSDLRIPDTGLSVCGPLQLAHETRPRPTEEDALRDWVIGTYESMESGICFDPECLVRLELGTKILTAVSEPPKSPLSAGNHTDGEYYEPPLPQVELTPVGQAVLEMAWIGALSIITFGTVP